ncbi:hypothetical protein GIB67_018719 [Kingdonia uniflora]|uniref:Uncharacterized protein n=1 Tax=Kingdonia uniflora TaxID=39325 RepID=A0A7J7L256_9MAGN|nr:hypothetical protein GIB67_018719 [Kingdonia uniflora]
MPSNLSSMSNAVTAFMRILGSSKESFKKILVRGEFDEYPEDVHMHCMAQMALNFSEGLRLLPFSKKLSLGV